MLGFFNVLGMFMMEGLIRVEPLLIEAELLHAGLCFDLMCSPMSKVKREKRRKNNKTKIKRTLIEELLI
jgi:hypothetical protein